MQINRLPLANALKRLASIIPSRASLPVLECVLIQYKEGFVHLSGTNLDQHISTRFPLEASETFSCAVNYRQFKAIADSIDSASMDLSITRGNLHIKGGNSKYRIPAMDAGEFPDPPVFTPDSIRKTPSKTLEDALGLVLPSASNDEARFILNAILLDFPLGELRTVATDGRRLSIHGPNNAAEAYSLLPKGAVKAILEACQDKGEVTIDIGERAIAFAFPSCRIASRLVEGTYPNFGQVIPKDNTVVVSLPPEPLRNALHRAKIILSENMVVRLNFSKGLLTVSSAEANTGESSETIELDNAAEFSFACNPDYLLNILTPQITEPVSLAFHPTDAGLNPLLLTAGKTKHIIMPIRVS